MSVTFAIESNSTGAFTAHCYESDLTLGPVVGYDAIVPVLVAHKAECEECAHYGIFSQAVQDVNDTLDVNVSNVNARAILGAIGFDPDGDSDLSGMADGAEFLGAVLIALAMVDLIDSGVPATREGNWIDCGREAGYMADRLDALHALGQEAVRLGRSVVWS